MLSPGGAERKCDVACRCRRPPPRAEKVRKFGARPRSTRRRFEIGETRERDIPIWRFLKRLILNSYLPIYIGFDDIINEKHFSNQKKVNTLKAYTLFEALNQ